MIKKNWEMPELNELGLSQTKCDEGLVGDEAAIADEKLIFGCPYCWNRYWSKDALENHIKKCHPEQREPGSMLPGPGEGLVPIS